MRMVFTLPPEHTELRTRLENARLLAEWVSLPTTRSEMREMLEEAARVTAALASDLGENGFSHSEFSTALDEDAEPLRQPD